MLSFKGHAFNQAPDSQNQIHSDEMAQQYGFRGGLVPGVTLSAYLTQPAVTHWGLSYLERGQGAIKILRPVYHEEAIEIVVNATSDRAYTAELMNSEGEVRAIAKVSLAEAHDLPEPPVRQSLPRLSLDYRPPIASPETFARLKSQGTYEAHYRWSRDHSMANYFAKAEEMPALLGFSKLSDNTGGFANTSFLLGCGNWVFASNAAMNPWVHLETQHQWYRPVVEGTEVAAQLTVEGLFEKKGHQFADVRVNLFDAASSQALASIWQRAIYQLRR